MVSFMLSGISTLKNSLGDVIKVYIANSCALSIYSLMIFALSLRLSFKSTKVQAFMILLYLLYPETEYNKRSVRFSKNVGILS